MGIQARTAIVACLVIVGAAVAQDTAPTREMLPGGATLLEGAVATADSQIQPSKTAFILLPTGQTPAYRIQFRLRYQPAPQGTRIGHAVLWVDPQNNGSSREPGRAMLQIAPSTGERDGQYLRQTAMAYDREQGKWVRTGVELLKYWPDEKRGGKWMRDDGIEPRTWHDRWIPVTIEVTPEGVRASMEGRYVFHVGPSDTGGPLRLVFELGANDFIDNLRVAAIDINSRFVPIDLVPHANASFDAAPKPPAGDVPFKTLEGEQNQVSLRQACFRNGSTSS